eukprot:6177003-Pleurochrysis_carterae.AAC.1
MNRPRLKVAMKTSDETQVRVRRGLDKITISRTWLKGALRPRNPTADFYVSANWSSEASGKYLTRGGDVGL